MTRPRKKSRLKRDSNPGSSALEADAQGKRKADEDKRKTSQPWQGEGGCCRETRNKRGEEET